MMWKTITDYEGLYEVSDNGDVRSLNYNKTNKVKNLVLCKDRDGYLIVSLHKNGIQKAYRTHRLVATEFIPNKDKKPCIDHINGDKTDNRVENLRWCTPAENNNNPITKVRMKGIQNGRQLNRKDCSKKVIQYDANKKIIKKYPSASEAARQMNCHIDTIAKACRGTRNKALNYYWNYDNK